MQIKTKYRCEQLWSLVGWELINAGVINNDK